MAEFTLPKNSVIKGKGRSFTDPAGPGRTRKFKIYRYDPDSGENPRYDDYELNLDETGPMVLDALLRIKNDIDSTTTYSGRSVLRDLRSLLDEHDGRNGPPAPASRL